MAENSNNNKNEKLESDPLQEVKYIPTSKEDDQKLHPEQNVKRSDTIYLIFSVITGTLLMMVGGTSLVWASPAIPILKSNDTNINPIGRPITTVEMSSLLGIPVFTGIIGSLFLPSLADKIGRKMSLQIMGLGMFLSGIGMAFSTTVLMMTSCGCVLGIFFSGALGILPIYLTEICEDHNRAKYGCFMTGFIAVGQLYTYIIGPMFGLRNLTLLLEAPMVFFLIFFLFAPESPVYVLSKGRKEECIKILQKLRSNKTMSEIDDDYYKISQSLQGSKNKKKSNFWTVFKSKEGRCGLLLATLPLTAQYFCGVPIIMPLMAPIFNEAGISLSGSSIAIIVGCFKVATFTVTSLLVEKTGRRPMLLLSSFTMGIPISALGIFFYLKHIDSPLINHLQWLPLVSILSYIFFYALGLGPLPLAIMSELFPTDVRSYAISLVTTVTAGLLSFYLFIYPFFVQLVGIHFCMWTFGITNVTFGIIFYFALPETKGKSVYEIQEVLKNY